MLNLIGLDWFIFYACIGQIGMGWPAADKVWGSSMCLWQTKCLGARLHRFLIEQHAVSGTEYAIMLALIVMGSMTVIGSIGSKFAVLYTMIADAVDDTM